MSLTLVGAEIHGLFLFKKIEIMDFKIFLQSLNLYEIQELKKELRNHKEEHSMTIKDFCERFGDEGSFEMSVRMRNCLWAYMAHKDRTKIIDLRRGDLLKMRGFGEVTLYEFIRICDQNNIKHNLHKI